MKAWPDRGTRAHATLFGIGFDKGLLAVYAPLWRERAPIWTARGYAWPFSVQFYSRFGWAARFCRDAA